MNKYQALAILSPYGRQLRTKVEEQWPAWEAIVRRMNLPNSAEYIYAEAVWELGFTRIGIGADSSTDTVRRGNGLGGKLSQLEVYMLDSWLEQVVRTCI